MKLKTYNRREFENLLNENGYEFTRSKGSHFIYKKENSTISVPRNLNKMVGRRLIKEHNLTR